MRAEGIWLPINPRNANEVNIDLLHRFEGELLFYHSRYEAEALEIQARVPGIRELVLIDVPEGAADSLTDWARGYEDQVFAIGPECEGDLLALFPTGGTTGKPKSVMMSHKAIETMFANFWAAWQVPDSVAPIVGNSGVTSALLGAFLVLFPRSRIGVIVPLGLYLQLIRVPAILLIGSWVGLQLMYTFFMPGLGAVAWWTHLAGFTTGLLVAAPARWYRKGRN